LKFGCLNLLQPSGPVQELLYLPFTFLHPCKENYLTRNKEQTSNFVKEKKHKKGMLGKRKGKGTLKYGDSKTVSPGRELVIKVSRHSYGYAAASVHLMRMSVITMAVVIVVLVIVGVLMLSLKAISQQI
jgi:hypothetical protein